VGPNDKTAFILQTLQLALYNRAFVKDAKRSAVTQVRREEWLPRTAAQSPMKITGNTNSVTIRMTKAGCGGQVKTRISKHVLSHVVRVLAAINLDVMITMDVPSIWTVQTLA
jgi:hypothetical protein